MVNIFAVLDVRPILPKNSIFQFAERNSQVRCVSLHIKKHFFSRNKEARHFTNRMAKANAFRSKDNHKS